MPLWRIWYPAGAWTEKEKQQLSQAITKLYVERGGLPAFYVVVIYSELSSAETAYVGGELRNNFVRITVDQIARDSTQAPLAQQKAWMDTLENAIAPFIKERGLDWEIHIDQTPRSLWRVQGIDPPEHGSPAADFWFKENKPVPIPKELL